MKGALFNSVFIVFNFIFMVGYHLESERKKEKHANIGETTK